MNSRVIAVTRDGFGAFLVYLVIAATFGLLSAGLLYKESPLCASPAVSKKP